MTVTFKALLLLCVRNPAARCQCCVMTSLFQIMFYGFSYYVELRNGLRARVYVTSKFGQFLNKKICSNNGFSLYLYLSPSLFHSLFLSSRGTKTKYDERNYTKSFDIVLYNKLMICDNSYDIMSECVCVKQNAVCPPARRTRCVCISLSRGLKK